MHERRPIHYLVPDGKSNGQVNPEVTPVDPVLPQAKFVPTEFRMVKALFSTFLEKKTQEGIELSPAHRTKLFVIEVFGLDPDTKPVLQDMFGLPKNNKDFIDFVSPSGKSTDEDLEHISEELGRIVSIAETRMGSGFLLGTQAPETFERDLEIAKLRAEGKTGPEIKETLGISQGELSASNNRNRIKKNAGIDITHLL